MFASLPAEAGPWDVYPLPVFAGKDLFGAEPFDPFTCGAADFPPDIQSKLDEMQVSACLRLIPPLCVWKSWLGWNPAPPVWLIITISTF